MKASVPVSVTIRYKPITWVNPLEPVDWYAVGGMALAAVCFLLGFVAGKL